MAKTLDHNSFEEMSFDWQKACIAILVERQVIEEPLDGNFQPLVTKAEFAVMLTKAFPDFPYVYSSAIQFDDVPLNYWAYEAISSAYQKGFFSSKFFSIFSEGIFKPDEPVKRFEALVTLVCVLNYPPPKNVPELLSELLHTTFTNAEEIPLYAQEAIAVATEKGMVVLSTRDEGSQAQLNPLEDLNRADIAALLCQALFVAGSLPTSPIPQRFVALSTEDSFNIGLKQLSVAAEKAKISEEAKTKYEATLEATIKYFSKAIKLRTDYGEAYYRRGLAYSLLGADQNAIEDYAQALLFAPDAVRDSWYAYPKRPTKDFIQILQSSPEDAEAYYERGVVRYYLTDYEGAYRDLTKAIELNPNLAKAYYMRACSQSPSNPRWDRAFADLTQAIQLNPNFTEAYSIRGIIRRHIALWEWTFDENQKHESDEEWEKLKEENERQAISDFTKAMQINPEIAEDYYSSEIFSHATHATDFEAEFHNPQWRGYSHWQKVVDAYTKVLRLNPQYKFSDFEHRLRSCLDPKDTQKAIESYNQVIQLHPNDADSYFIRGIAYNELGNLQEAIEDYNQVIHLNPKDIDAYLYRGVAYYRLKEYKKAIADYTNAIELNLEEAEIYFVRGLARYESSDLEGAIVDTTLALQLKLDSGYWFQRSYLIRGLAIAALGNRKAAEDDYRSFLPNPGEIDYLSLCEMFYEECPGGGGVFHTALGREANKQAAGRRRHK